MGMEDYNYLGNFKIFYLIGWQGWRRDQISDRRLSCRGMWDLGYKGFYKLN